jgi:outer membrane protein assembly factor BamA
MRRSILYHFFTLLFSVFAYSLSAQGIDSTLQGIEEPEVHVGKIILSGNKKTREAIILRELPFREGENYTLRELVKKFGVAKTRLMNTALFTDVVVAAKDITGETIDVWVELRERWYIFPLPYFKLVDRNLNQWLVEQHADLNRVNYGAKLYYNNATGNNDKLRVGFSAGYTRQVNLMYDRLYIDKAMKWGMRFSFAAGKNREINYNTVNDKQVFLKGHEDFLRRFTNTSFQLTHRKAIKTRHSFGFNYSSEEVSDTIVALNPRYFRNGRNRISFPGISYTMNYFDLDYIPYPTKGYAAEIGAGKSGFNSVINIWYLQVKALGAWPVSDKQFIVLSGFAGLKLPFHQPYFNQRMFGYGDVYMQGYEYYVIDGAAGGYIKASLNRELFRFNINTPQSMKQKTLQSIPFRIYARVFGNAGYVHQPDPGENTLANRMLYSGGIGLDIFTMYDVTFKLEWSFNSLGQNGLFLHRKSIF